MWFSLFGLLPQPRARTELYPARANDLCPLPEQCTRRNLGEPCEGRQNLELPGNSPGYRTVEECSVSRGRIALAANPLCWREALGYRCQSFPRNGAPGLVGGRLLDIEEVTEVDTQFAMPGAPDAPMYRRQVSFDLALVVMITAAAFGLSSALELRDRQDRPIRVALRRSRLELPLTLAALAFSRLVLLAPLASVRTSCICAWRLSRRSTA
jgi:hypothetical protein